MTDVTQQLLSSVRKVLDMRRWGFGEHPYLEPHGDEALALHEMDEALTAYEASRAAPEFGPLDPAAMDLGTWRPDAAPDDVVEAVAKAVSGALIAAFKAGWGNSSEGYNAEYGPLDDDVTDTAIEETKEFARIAARAALSALPARDDALEGLLAKALRRLAYWAQTSGGTAGRDDGLVAAIDVGLAALRQYDTKHAAPAQEPRS